MNVSDYPGALDSLTSALGGKKLYAILWLWWIFAAISGHYALTLPERENVSGTALAAMIVGIAGLFVCSWQLLQCLASRKRREELLAKQPDAPHVRTVFRLLVWTVPLLGLGAIFAPLLIK